MRPGAKPLPLSLAQSVGDKEGERGVDTPGGERGDLRALPVDARQNDED